MGDAGLPPTWEVVGFGSRSPIGTRVEQRLCLWILETRNEISRETENLKGKNIHSRYNFAGSFQNQMY